MLTKPELVPADSAGNQPASGIAKLIGSVFSAAGCGPWSVVSRFPRFRLNALGEKVSLIPIRKDRRESSLIRFYTGTGDLGVLDRTCVVRLTYRMAGVAKVERLSLLYLLYHDPITRSRR
jgi:hypothetical protein